MDGLLSEVSAVLGIETTWEILGARRGTLSARSKERLATGDRCLVKVAVATPDGGAKAIAPVEREALVLQDVPSLRTERFLLANLDSDSPHVASRWTEGEHALKAIRHRRELGLLEHSDFESLALGALQALATLHQSGWAHGDFQPDHLIRTSSSPPIAIIDFGYAQSETAPFVGYQGGLVHFNAPELCADIANEGFASATTQSDMFSFGSVMWYAASERLLPDYTADEGWRDIPWEQMLAAIASHRYSFNEEVLDDAFGAAVGSAIADCLESDPQNRPASAAQMLRDLT